MTNIIIRLHLLSLLPPWRLNETLGFLFLGRFKGKTFSMKRLLIPGNTPNASSTLPQIQGRPQLNTEIKQEVNMDNPQKSLPTNPSSIYGQAILQSKSGLGGGGFLAPIVPYMI